MWKREESFRVFNSLLVYGEVSLRPEGYISPSIVPPCAASKAERAKAADSPFLGVSLISL